MEQVKNVAPDVLTATVPTAVQRTANSSSTTTSGGAPITIYDPNTTVPDPNNPGVHISARHFRATSFSPSGLVRSPKTCWRTSRCLTTAAW